MGLSLSQLGTGNEHEKQAVILQEHLRDKAMRKQKQLEKIR